MENSRNNKDFNPTNCPVTHCINRIGGKWKAVIIHLIRQDCNRFSRLHRSIPGISRQMLVNQLRELEEDRILERIIYAEIPPKVEYTLTEYGQSLLSVIDTMQNWGLNDLIN